MALYEVTVSQLFQGQVCVNRWNYETTSVPAAVTGSFALASAFGGVLDEGAVVPGTVIAQMAAIQGSSVDFVDILVRNVYDPVDFYQTPLGNSGTVAGDMLPPFAAYGFSTNRTTLAIRRGTKRFVGVSEGSQQNGSIISAALAAQALMATRMSAVLHYIDEGADLAYSPVIVSKEPIAPTPENGHKGVVYQYYSTLAAQATHLMRNIVWTNYPTVRSQTSRQFGRGQ